MTATVGDARAGADHAARHRRAGDRHAHHERVARSTAAPTTAPGRITESMTDAPADDGRRLRRRCCAPTRRRRPRPSARSAQLVAGARSAGHEVEVGREVQLRPTGVDPVVVGGAAVEAAARRRSRERVALDRRPCTPAGSAVEHRRLEHVGAGVDQVARLGAGRRLLDEAPRPDAGRRSVSTTPNARRIVDRRSGGSSPSAPPTRWCVATSRGHVEIGEDVTVGDDERLVDAGRSAAKRIAPAVSSGSGSTA